jgi:hypothetical protein
MAIVPARVSFCRSRRSTYWVCHIGRRTTGQRVATCGVQRRRLASKPTHTQRRERGPTLATSWVSVGAPELSFFFLHPSHTRASIRARAGIYVGVGEGRKKGCEYIYLRDRVKEERSQGPSISLGLRNRSFTSFTGAWGDFGWYLFHGSFSESRLPSPVWLATCSGLLSLFTPRFTHCFHPAIGSAVVVGRR